MTSVVLKFEEEINFGIQPGNIADVYIAEVTVGNINIPGGTPTDAACRAAALVHKRAVSNNSTGASTYNWGTGTNVVELRALVTIELTVPGTSASANLIDYSITLKKVSG